MAYRCSLPSGAQGILLVAMLSVLIVLIYFGCIDQFFFFQNSPYEGSVYTPRVDIRLSWLCYLTLQSVDYSTLHGDETVTYRTIVTL